MATASSIPVNTTPMESDKEESFLGGLTTGLSGLTTGLSGLTSGVTEKYNSFLAPKSPPAGGSSCGSYDKKRSSRKRKGGAGFAKYMNNMSAMAQQEMSTAQQGMSDAEDKAKSMSAAEDKAKSTMLSKGGRRRKSMKKGKKHHKKSMKKGKKLHKKSMKKGKKHHKKSMKKGKKSRMRGGDPVLGTYEFNGDMRFKGSPPMVPPMPLDEEE